MDHIISVFTSLLQKSSIYKISPLISAVDVQSSHAMTDVLISLLLITCSSCVKMSRMNIRDQVSQMLCIEEKVYYN